MEVLKAAISRSFNGELEKSVDARKKETNKQLAAHARSLTNSPNIETHEK